jgi:molecular chaperone GrpE
MKTDAKDGIQENTIVEVIQKGYKYKDRVIRYSMVKVAVDQ